MKEEREYQIILSFLFDAKSEEDAKKKFIEAYGKKILDEADDVEIWWGIKMVIKQVIWMLLGGVDGEN